MPSKPKLARGFTKHMNIVLGGGRASRRVEPDADKDQIVYPVNLSPTVSVQARHVMFGPTRQHMLEWEAFEMDDPSGSGSWKMPAGSCNMYQYAAPPRLKRTGGTEISGLRLLRSAASHTHPSPVSPPACSFCAGTQK